jgi:hypothetical protein
VPAESSKECSGRCLLVASLPVAVVAERAFEILADPIARQKWTLGSVERRWFSDDTIVGTSSFDGRALYSRLVSHRELLMFDSYVGDSPDDLRPLVQIRIKRGQEIGIDPSHCVVTMISWRSADVSEEDWERQYYVWRTEIHLLKAVVEAAA